MPQDSTTPSEDSREIPVIDLQGSDHEIGHLHGERLREEIRAFYEKLLDQMCTEGGTTEEELLAYSSAHLPAATDYAPELVDEIRGISEGADFPFEKIFLINCFDEVCWHGPKLLKKSLRGCTAFAATGRATVGGKCYIGQSWDVPAYYPPFFFRIAHESGVEGLIFSHPGLLGGCGMNNRGLAMVWTSLKSNDAGVGVPAPLIVRKALRATDLGALIGNVIRSSRANGMNFIAADESGAVDIELSATRHQVTYSPGILTRANHYESSEMLRFEADLPLSVPDTYLRSGRIRELLEQHAGAIDNEVLMNIYCDHAHPTESICRHSALGWPTCVAAIFDPSQCVMWASNGRPCEAGFAQYSLPAHA